MLQRALADLNVAYRNFFASLSGKRKGHKLAPPRFRSRKDNRQAIRFTRNSRFKVLDNGRLQTTSEPLPETDTEAGIDLGLTHFAVLSDGTKVAAPMFLRRAARRLKRLQQALSRKQRGSQNRKKVARAHARVADTRRDWQHKLSTAIIRDHRAVYVEGPVRGRSGPDPAGQVRARCRLGSVHGHARVQRRPVRAHLRQGRPVPAQHENVLGLRPLPVRQHP